MPSIPSSKDSVVREVIWKSWGGPGVEHLRLIEKDDSVEADGLVIDTYEVGAFRLRYRILCDAGWRVRQLHLELIGGQGALEYSADGEGHWVDGNGMPIGKLDGCIDVDIGGSPFTNTLPIRRLGLQPGQSADLPMLYVYVPTLQVERTMQRYTCLGAGPEGRTYRFEALDSGYSTVLAVDANGLVMDYPELARRAWSGEYRTAREGA